MNKRHFKRFYQKNFDKIYKFIFFRVGGDRDLAEDLVSEIFVKALDKFHSYDPEKSSVAWIYTIARNHLANYFRSKYFRDVEPLEVDVWWQDQTWHMIDQDNDKKAFFNMLKQLKKHEQRLVTLKYVEGYNYKEMSKILAKPKTTLRVATHRAVLKLKKLAQTYELRETGEQSKQGKPARKQV
ncbi:RNA polymerase sigma factor [Patescibacteria group bacterium]|nr:RNA polymerase sigma factor [Patescibacteria group bacterium]MBU1921811.1 RNA polymerase sigma factor [Patescibacteria group bacterium]